MRCRTIPWRLSLLAAVALAAGCQESEEIVQYTVPKQAAVDAANPSPVGTVEQPKDNTPPQHRMLAAMVPHESKAWFFKVVGPIDDVADIEQPFRAFIQSVVFEGDQPRWTTPTGWRQEPGDGEMRYATLRIGSNPSLELTVVPLDMPVDDAGGQYTVQNVNRWRKEMGLQPIRRADLTQSTEELQLKTTQATLVNLVGNFTKGMTPPFAGGL